MKFKVVYNWNVILRHKWAIVLWPYMLFNATRKEVTHRWFRHELQHCYQVKTNGRLKFYAKYLAYHVKHGYDGNPFEVEARARENDPLTPEELKWFQTGRIKL